VIARRASITVALVAISAGLLSIDGSCEQQKFDKFKMEQGLRILDGVHEEVKKHYYDPTFHGTKFDEEYAKTKEIMRTVDSLNRDFGLIADMLDTLQDSHTFFVPRPGHITLNTDTDG
jgi:hypothetical protein